MVPDFVGITVIWDRLFSGTYQEKGGGNNKCYVYGIINS